jgi:hypothetical protein
MANENQTANRFVNFLLLLLLLHIKTSQLSNVLSLKDDDDDDYDDNNNN